MRKLFKSLIHTVILVSIASNGLAYGFVDPLEGPDGVVYCPLQKKWVFESPQRSRSRDTFCSASRKKLGFLAALSNLSPNSKDVNSNIDELFLVYIEDGEEGLVRFISPSRSEHEVTVFGETHPSAALNKNVTDIYASVFSGIANFARPPTSSTKKVHGIWLPIPHSTCLTAAVLARPPPTEIS